MDGGLIVFSLLATFFAAALTVPAGFGLATMITPVVFLWLEPHEAVAVVGIVHGSHNAWKLKVLRKSVDYDAVKRYGWAMVVGALIGAALNTAVEADPLLLIVGIALVILPLLSISEKWTNTVCQKLKIASVVLVLGSLVDSLVIKGRFGRCFCKNACPTNQNMPQQLRCLLWLLM